MLDFLNVEKQAGKRVKNLLLHKSTAAGIDVATAKFVISIRNEQVTVRLFNNNTPVRVIELKEITDFFGKQYDPAGIAPFKEYLAKLANDNKMPVENLHVIIREIEKEKEKKMICYLYNMAKPIKEIPTLEILNNFNSDND